MKRVNQQSNKQIKNQRKPRVMLSIAPWDLFEDSGGEDIYSIGIASLAAILEKNGYEVDALSLSYSKWEDVREKVIRKLKEFKPDFFGVSILSNSRVSTHKLLDVVKKLYPSIPIIAGGVHTTFLFEQVLNNYPVDFAVIGEGDITIIELLNAIKNKRPIQEFKKIKGIAFKQDKEIIKTEPRERIRDLDSLPFPKHELFEELIKRRGIVYLMTSRGCPFSCSFCPSSAFWGRCMIQRSAKNVMKEIKYLLKKFPNVGYLYFIDDEFVCNHERIKELCNLMLKEKINVKWNCLGRVSSMNEEIISLMKKAGCFEIIFGVESGSQRILDRLGKRVKVSEIINAFELCKKYNITTRYLTIVGLPGEDKKSVQETIDLAVKLKEGAEPAILIVYPGTEVCRLAKECGLITDDYWLTDGLPPLYTCEHSKKKLWWWAFKAGIIAHFHAHDGDLVEYIDRKLAKKLSPANFMRVFKRYVSDKT